MSGLLHACTAQVLLLEQARPSPLTGEALRWIGGLYAIEEAIWGRPSQERLRVRQEQARPLHDALEGWLRETVTRLSRKSDTTAAILYALNRWQALTYFCHDGAIEIDNSAAKRALGGVALTQKELPACWRGLGRRACGDNVLARWHGQVK